MPGCCLHVSMSAEVGATRPTAAAESLIVGLLTVLLSVTSASARPEPACVVNLTARKVSMMFARSQCLSVGACPEVYTV